MSCNSFHSFIGIQVHPWGVLGIFEARAGIEPAHSGFADHGVSTSPSGRIAILAYLVFKHKNSCGKLANTKMRQIKTVIITTLVILFLIGLIFFLIGYFKPKQAGIYVEADPKSFVFVNGAQVGVTPYRTTREPGAITLKIVPQSSDTLSTPFETKLTLTAGIETVVRREFGKSDDESVGEIVSFGKVAADETSLVVVSIPDNAQVLIDGTVYGFAPYKTSSVTAGQHRVTLEAPGYKDRTISVKTITGYKLTAVVKLAKGEEMQAEPTPTPKPQVYVEVLDTPNGFLRVRQEANIDSAEVGRVKTGDKLLLLDDSATDWFKVEFSDPDASTTSGWISAQYASISR